MGIVAAAGRPTRVTFLMLGARRCVGVQPKPGAEVDVDEALVRALLTDQHPDLASLPIALVASGWDNAMYRLGDDLVVRLPRRLLSARLVEHEQQCLPGLAPTLPLPVPVPLRVGRPALGFPWSWSVCPWIPGRPAARGDALGERAAEVMGRFLEALHQPAPPDVPDNPYRGIPLAERTERLHINLDQVRDIVDADAVIARWDRLVATPPWAGPPLWLHGDLHPNNILVVEGEISGVIDFGDICGGDPATDLAVAWSLLRPEARPVLRAAAGDVDDDTWARAQGWALVLALAYLANSADDPAFHAVGARMLDAVLADEA